MRALYQSGAHLLEIALFLVLLALAANFAQLTTREFTQTKLLRAEARHLSRALEATALMASEREQQYEIQLANDHYRRVGDDNQVDLHHTLPTEVILQANVARLRFHPTGAVSPATLTLTSKDVQCHIRLSLRGRVIHEC